MSDSSISVKKSFTGFHMLAIMVSFFGVVIAMNILLAVMALRSNSGLVVDDSYESSQSFDKDTAKLLADAALDIHPQISFANGTLDIVLHTAQGAPVATQSVAVTLGRAVSANTDVTPTFKLLSVGHYQALTHFGLGRWLGKISVQLQNGETWTQPFQLVVKTP